MKKYISIILALLILCSVSVSACPSPSYCQYCGEAYGCCACGTSYNYYCSSSTASCNYQNYTDYSSYEGCGYFDRYGHYCEYSGHYDSCGNYIVTVGYYENGIWCPAEYDPMLDIGYYDVLGVYHYYCESSFGYTGYSSYDTSFCCSCGGYGCDDCGWTGYAQYLWDDYSYCNYYDENDTWACDNLQWLEEQDDDWCSDNWLIDVDVTADTINIVNNGVIIYSGACTCTSAYSGQEFCFSDQRCAGIWNTCSSGFYEQACNYVSGDCMVCCH